MSFRSRRLEKVLRRGVRQRLRSSPRLQAESVRVKRARRRPILLLVIAFVGLVFGSPMLFVFCPLFVLHELYESFGADAILEAQSGASVLLSLGLALHLATQLQKSQPISVLSHLPLSDRALFRYLRQQTLVVALAVLYLNALAYGSYAYWSSCAPWYWCLAVLIAIGQWVVCLAIFPIVAACFSQAAIRTALIGLSVAWFLYLKFGDKPWSPEVATATFIASPTGWLNGFLTWGLVQGQTVAWWALVPTGMLFATGFLAIRSMESRYQIVEFAIRPGEEIEALTESTVSRIPASRGNALAALLSMKVNGMPEVPSAPMTLETAKQHVRDRGFLNKQDWTRLGWIERLVDRWLTPRERVIVEFLSGQEICWTRPWLGVAVLLAFYSLGLLLVNFFPAQMPPYAALLLYGIVLFTIPAVVSSAILGAWPQFRSRLSCGVYVTPVADFPLGFEEISRAMGKVQLVRSLAFWPFILAMAMLATLWRANWPVEAMVLSLACLGLLTLSIPWI
ncbi:MAG: hypothetical protein JWM11_7889, partial [Planctomycetaceae bacterium]|nr:hypothetical protein [Planctomycetaceae bacterium]